MVYRVLRYRVIVYVQSDARMNVASSMFNFEQFSNSSSLFFFLDIMNIYIGIVSMQIIL